MSRSASWSHSCLTAELTASLISVAFRAGRWMRAAKESAAAHQAELTSTRPRLTRPTVDKEIQTQTREPPFKAICCAVHRITGICDLDGGPLGRHDRWCGPPSASNQSSELITSTSTTPDPLPSSSLTRLKTPLIWQVELGRVGAKQHLGVGPGLRSSGSRRPSAVGPFSP